MGGGGEVTDLNSHLPVSQIKRAETLAMWSRGFHTHLRDDRNEETTLESSEARVCSNQGSISACVCARSPRKTQSDVCNRGRVIAVTTEGKTRNSHRETTAAAASLVLLPDFITVY